MTNLIKHSQPVLPDLFDRLFNDDVFFGFRPTALASVPVNIRNTDTSFELQIAAPGLKKDDFTIRLDRDLLTVSFEHKEESDESSNGWIRREFRNRSFNRSFHLDDTVDADGIAATYADGILTLTIPKVEPSKLPVRTISVN